jgi:Ca-activated chloride channel family protein
MFRFEHPEFFWLAFLPILVVSLYFLRKYFTGADWKHWGTVGSNDKAQAEKSLRPRWLWLGIVASIGLIIAAANPQWGYRAIAVESKSADIYLVMDISNSMLAEDIAPSRLERARRMALDLSTAFKTDRVGLILFAGNAYMQSPLTTDWHAIQLFLNAANPNQAGTQGTAIGEAVRLATKSKSDEDAAGQGALIILTDGEDHDQDAPEAIKEATAEGWATYIIGFGTEQGGMIPVSISGRRDVKRDKNGQPVQTALNRPLMQELAREGGGKYYDADEGSTIVADLKEELAGLERSQMEKRSFSEHRSYFQWFLFPAVLLIFALVSLNYKFDVI